MVISPVISLKAVTILLSFPISHGYRFSYSTHLLAHSGIFYVYVGVITRSSDLGYLTIYSIIAKSAGTMKKI